MVPVPRDASPGRSGGWRPVVLQGADIALWPDWLSPAEAAGSLAALQAEVPWRQESVRLFGKAVPQPRLTAWFGDADAGYRYSGLALAPLPWSPRLADLRDRVEAAAGARFDSCLATLYRDGDDAIGPHADDERELGPEPVIAALSLGETRPLVFRPRRTLRHAGLGPGDDVTTRAGAGAGAGTGTGTATTLSLPLPPGSLVVMRGRTQHAWTHAIPRTRRACGPRVSLTFRCVTATRGAG